MRISTMILVLSGALATMLVSSGSAGATTCAPPGCGHHGPTMKVYADVRTDFIGWGRVDAERCRDATVSHYCRTTVAPGNPACGHPSPPPACRISDVQTDVVGYRWTAWGWKAEVIRDRTPAYLHPFAAGWSWAWTRSTGWMAVRSEVALVRDGACYYQDRCPTY